MDMNKLWAAFAHMTQFRDYRNAKKNACTCIERGDGITLRYCQKHNTRRGTHTQ